MIRFTIQKEHFPTVNLLLSLIYFKRLYQVKLHKIKTSWYYDGGPQGTRAHGGGGNDGLASGQLLQESGHSPPEPKVP